MWKKDDENNLAVPGAKPYTPPETRGERAVIGPSIIIKGDLIGDEDMIIEGRVEGKVDLKQHKVTIGRKGVIRADVHARIVTIEGDVQGTVNADEQIVLGKTCNVRGDMIALRVSLEDGARFKGSIDMEPKGVERPQGGERPRATVVEAKQAAAAFEQKPQVG